MDAADKRGQAVLAAQGRFLGEQQQRLGELDVCISQLTVAVSQALLAPRALTMHAYSFDPMISQGV